MNRDDDLAALGLRQLEGGDLAIRRLENAVEGHCGKPPHELSLAYRRQDILEGERFYYLPVSWIGCCGMLVLKPNHEVVVFGSFVGPATHIWAWNRGVSFDGENDLRILAVHDEAMTLRCLKSIWTARYVNNVLKPALRSELPLTISSSELYFGIGDLREAEEESWFTFEVHPPTTTGDPGAGDAVRRSPFS